MQFSSFFRLLAVLAVATALSGCNTQSDANSDKLTSATKASTATAESTTGTDEIHYPRTIQVNDRSVVLHPPQVRSWKDFDAIEGVMVVELVPEGKEKPRFAVAAFTANAFPNLADRTVELSNLEIETLTESGTELPEATRELIADALPKARTLPLDLALSYLAEDVIPGTTEGIKSEPPKLFVSKGSAVLVLLHGDPLWVDVGDNGLQFAANTNWPLFKSRSGMLYLNNDDTWLSAKELEGGWGWADTLDAELNNLPANGDWKSSRKAAAEWQRKPKFPPPRVFVSTTPAELLLLVGEPQFEQLGDTGIAYVTNTDSELFRYRDVWYYVVAGRWFSARDLEGDWSAVTELPEVFAQIPADGPKGDILALVPGAPEAKMAALETQIPKITTVAIGTELPEEVTYAGEPKFVGIEGSTVSYAVNTAEDILLYDGRYYLCYSGVWYTAVSPVGPWTLATSVPQAIYDMPASSPVYHTTHVHVYDYDDSDVHVTYGYTSGYNNTYLYYGVPVYGSGWYYPPYYGYYGGYPYYYHYPYTYGSGSYYNPRTGSYGSVSRAYGPYGGWGYASSYNPRTGRYARVETAWDYDDWYASGEAYNPRTGRYYETDRHYDADDNDWKVESKLNTERGDVAIRRSFDDDSGKLQIATDRGGAGTFTRRASDGGWDTSGQFTTGDGRTLSSSGRFDNGQGSVDLRGSEGLQGTVERDVGARGVTREGTFTKDGKTIDTRTTRTGRSPTTTIEGSGGNSAVVSGRIGNRTAIGQTESGDVYAGRDGSVYKRTDDGWQQRDGNAWSPIERVGDRSSANRTYQRSPTTGKYNQRADSSRQSGSYSSAQNRQRSLNRDFGARQRGQLRSRDFSRARSSMARGGMRGRRR